MHGQKSSNFEAVGELDDGLRIEVQRDAVLLSRAVVRSAEVGRVWRGCEDDDDDMPPLVDLSDDDYSHLGYTFVCPLPPTPMNE